MTGKKHEVVLRQIVSFYPHKRTTSERTAVHTGELPNPPPPPTGSAFWAAALPLQGIKRWNLLGEGVYSRQCRVRISSCYSSKHNDFMLTKTITSSTHKTPRKVRKCSLLQSPWLLWPMPLLPASLWNVFFWGSSHHGIVSLIRITACQSDSVVIWSDGGFALTFWSDFQVLLARALPNLHETLVMLIKGTSLNSGRK